MDQYGNIDFYGLAIGILSFFLVFPYVYYLLQKFGLNRTPIINAVIFSAIGHFLGAITLYWFAITAGADSIFYFKNASTHYQGLGYYFAFLVLGYAKAYLLGESFLGAFLISGAIGFVASVYYLLTYKILLDKMSGPYPLYHEDPNQLIYPAFLLVCWPSYFFWSAAIIKDNFAFISISIILFVIARGKVTLSSLIMVIITSFLAFMVRPYLFVIFAFTAVTYLLLNSKLSVLFKIFILSLLSMLTILLLPLLGDYAMMLNFSSATVTNIGEYAVRQQQYMHLGSSIPIPTHNPHLTFLFLPYLVFANLFLPLGIGAHNMIGAISSVENIYFLGWAIFFIKNRTLWKSLKNTLRIASFFMIYSLVGMSCLSIMNSNLGLAMREKMMYVPAMLICIFLTYAYRRMLLIQQHHVEQEQQSALASEPT